MKLNLKSIGAVAGVVAISTVAHAQQTPSTTTSANYGAAQENHSQAIEGRIMSLADYLQGGMGAAGAGEQSSLGAGAAARTPSTGLGSVSALSISANQPLVLIASPSSWSGSPSQGAQGQPGTGLGTQDQPGDPGRSLTPGQTSPQQTPDRPSFSGTTPQSRLGQAQSGQSQPGQGSALGGSSGAGGQAYILIFDAQNPQSRAAMTSVQSYISSAESGAESSLDRLPVRGADDSTQPGVAQRDAVTDRLQAGRELSLNRSVGAQTAGGEKRVKVTGRVLSRGGIQAIEVASIEPAAGAAGATTGGAQGLQDSTQPLQELRDRGND